MTATLTLADFLLQRIAEDEAAARMAQTVLHMQASGDLGPIHPRQAASLPGDPARVLAECEAKRRIVELHRSGLDFFRDAAGEEHSVDGVCQEDGEDAPCDTLKLLAQPHASHPEFRAEWAL